MRFNFIEKKIQVSGEERAYAEKKVGKLDKFFRTESDAGIVFSSERGRTRVEITLNNNGMFYRATDYGTDVYASIDACCAAIERQVRKNKTRLEKRLREGAFEREVKEEYVPSAEDDDSDDEGEFKIVRTKRFSLKPMSAQEAILQMNLLEHEFYAFINVDDDDSFSVVYRRNNGGYGLISAADID